jgi:hypothetical protein
MTVVEDVERRRTDGRNYHVEVVSIAPGMDPS